MAHFLDIESKALSREEILKQAPEFTAPANWKDEDKIAAKIREKEDEFIEKAALNPATSSVMAIGIYDSEEDEYHGLVCGQGQTEADLLTKAWELITSNDAYTTPVIGFNILSFDLPFMIKRSWLLGVSIPSTTIGLFKGRTSFNPRFQDLAKIWTFGEYGKYASLNSVLRFFGLEEKVDLGDELFYQTYEKDPVKAMQYLERDVRGMVELSNYIKI